MAVFMTRTTKASDGSGCREDDQVGPALLRQPASVAGTPTTAWRMFGMASAQAAGATDGLWEVGDIVGLLD